MIRPLDHTADVGFEAEAPTLERLFEEAARGLVATALQNPPHSGERRERITLHAPDLEVLMVRWLNELIHLIQEGEAVPVAPDVEVRMQEGGWGLASAMSTAALDPVGQGWQGEIKGATFHGLKVEESGEGWRARVILDV